MPKIVNVDKNNFKEKLDFIGLNLEKIPKFLMDFEPLGFGTSSSFNDNEHKIFRYIPIQEIQLLISPTNRLTDIKEKYSLAKPISAYLDPNNIEEYATFLKMLNMASVEEIENIEKKQEEFSEEPPFAVQYDKDYAWQIYYSEVTQKYFMLVTSEDYDFNAFFYLLKEQIKFHKSRKKQEKQIYVPINSLNYSGEYLKKSEISDLENYLWLFTKNWPNIYEVYDKEGNLRLEIIGNTNVYKTITSGYKIILNSKEEAMQYYKELKALFILQTELSFHYKFDTLINEKCELELYYQLEKIDYTNIAEFINKEYKKIQKKIEKEKQNVGILEKKLEELKQTSAMKDLEYLNKQKEIAMYLEYKKTFFGKIKLFLKFKKKKDTDIKPDKTLVENEEAKESIVRVSKTETDNNVKEYYTIEDIITLYAKLDKETTYIKNMNSDIHALELKIKNIEKKIENATKYIEEIDNHKKSIFEFWKFVNKDELLAMEEASMQEKDDNSSNLKKVFDYNLDLLDLGIQMDKLQRKTISKEVHDSIFLLDTEVIESINMVKSNIEVDIDKLRESLNHLKDLAQEQQKFYKIEDFDIFGGVSDNTNRVKTLANKKHRETEKNMLKILNISRNTDVEEFKTRIEKVENLVNDNMDKIKASYDMPIYIATSNEQMIDKKGFGVYHIIPDKALEDVKNIASDKINLYKLEITEGMPLLYYTNIIYYDNFNETLPLGMNVSDKVAIDAAKFEFSPKNMLTFRVCEDFTENEVKGTPTVKTIMLCEYELKLKGQENKEEENKID